MKYVLILVLVFCLPARGANGPQINHLMPVSQGISSPTFADGLVYGTGFTGQNPSGLIYQNGVYISAFSDNGSDSPTGKGGMLSGGNETAAFGLGWYETECNRCDNDGDAYAGVAFNLGDKLTLGVKYVDEDFSAGLIINPTGKFRIGLMAAGGGDDYGVGFAVVEDDYTFSVDASKDSDLDPIIVTPGVAFRFSMMQVSLNYETVVNSDAENDEDFWFGIGLFGLKDTYISYRSDFFNEHNFLISYAF